MNFYAQRGAYIERKKERMVYLISVQSVHYMH